MYFVDKKKVKGSVAGVAHMFAEAFDADAVIGMQRSANWPRVGYLRQRVTFNDIQPLHIASPELLELFAGNPRNETRVCRLLQALRNDPALRAKVYCLAKTADEIRAQWAGSGQQAARDDGAFILVDWTRAAGLQATTCCASFRRMMKQPSQQLHDTKEIHYGLQLKTYRRKLGKYYNVVVSAMFVVCCRPEHRDNPLTLPVSRME